MDHKGKIFLSNNTVIAAVKEWATASGADFMIAACRLMFITAKMHS